MKTSDWLWYGAAAALVYKTLDLSKGLPAGFNPNAPIPSNTTVVMPTLDLTTL